MPLYEYRCRDCGHVTTFLESAKARGQHPCEKCHSARTDKVFSTFSAKISQQQGGTGNCPTGTCPLS